jgi:DNA anti-recombination protein RmuC
VNKLNEKKLRAENNAADLSTQLASLASYQEIIQKLEEQKKQLTSELTQGNKSLKVNNTFKN